MFLYQHKGNKSKKVKFELRRNVRGVLLDTDVKWQLGEQVNIEYSPNISNQICWEFEIGAGEEKTFTYRYDVYVRR